jgi:hypothetical protein
MPKHKVSRLFRHVTDWHNTLRSRRRRRTRRRRRRRRRRSRRRRSMCSGE